MECLEPAKRRGEVEGACEFRSRQLGGFSAPVQVCLVDGPPELLLELEVLTHKVAGTLLLSSGLHGRLLQLRAETANQALLWGSIPTGAQIPSTQLGSRLAALESSGRSERSGRHGWWRHGIRTRLPRPQPRGSQPADARPASEARTNQRNSAQSERKRSRAQPTVAKHSTAIPSTAIRSTGQRSEAQHSDSKHCTAGKRMQGKVMADQAQQGQEG